MNRLSAAAAVAANFVFIAASAAQTPPGTIVVGPPKDITMEVKTAADGGPILSANEFKLALGSYYRFNFVCTDAKDDTTGFHLEMTDMLANAHLRVVSINQIEVYLQGQTFRAIECDRAGTARVSFHPMRKGTYEIYVRNHETPPKDGKAKFVVE